MKRVVISLIFATLVSSLTSQEGIPVRPYASLDPENIGEILLFQNTHGGGPYIVQRSIRDKEILRQIGLELAGAQLIIGAPISPTPSTGVVILSKNREVLAAAASFVFGKFFLIRDPVWSNDRWILMKPPSHRYLPENEREKGIAFGRQGHEGFTSKTLTEQVRELANERD